MWNDIRDTDFTENTNWKLYKLNATTKPVPPVLLKKWCSLCKNSSFSRNFFVTTPHLPPLRTVCTAVKSVQSLQECWIAIFEPGNHLCSKCWLNGLVQRHYSDCKNVDYFRMKGIRHPINKSSKVAFLKALKAFVKITLCTITFVSSHVT